MRYRKSVAALVARLVAGQPNREGDRHALALALATAPFSNVVRTALDWVSIDAPRLQAVLGAPFPWQRGETPARRVAPDDLLDSATWHTLKHRELGHFVPSVTVMNYLDDLRFVAEAGLTQGAVIVGTDAKTGSNRVALLLRLVPGGGPAPHAANLHPGDHFFIAQDPERDCVVTGFPIRSARVHAGYPNWHNRKVVTR